jgi:tetratricopeptide (TPR) repeat protein
MGMATLSVSGPSPIAPRETPPLDLPDADDEFEDFGSAAGGMTTTFGRKGGASREAGFGGRDPFGGGAADPFGGGAADPFGGGAADPFGGGAATPFGGGGAATPFAGGGGGGGSGDIDFDALLGEVGSSPPPRRSSAAALAAAPSLDDDSLFGDVDDDSLFLASPSTSGALFDAAEEEGGGLGDVSRPSDGRSQPSSEVERKGLEERKGKGKGKGRKLVDSIVLLGLVVLGGGLALDYAGIPIPGMGHLLPALGLGTGEDPNADKRKERPVAQNLLEPTEIKDVAAGYQLEVSRLQQLADAKPDDPAIRKQLVDALLDLYERAPEALLADADAKAKLTALDPLPPRAELLSALAEGRLVDAEKMLPQLCDPADAAANALSSCAVGAMTVWRARLRSDALEHPGKVADPARDPIRPDGSAAEALIKAQAWSERALTAGKSQNNHIKFEIVQAQVDDARGQFGAVVARISDFVDATPDHPLATELLASAHIEENRLDKAAPLIKRLAGWAEDAERPDWYARAMHLEARLAARRGRTSDQITALQAALAKQPDDELTTVRLGRLLLAEKRAQECQKLLVEAKQAGMKSIAFEVALVEYWLWAHRYDDALAELTEATKNYPEAVDLLFLRGQVEEKQHHTATARDFFAKVLARDPEHLRAALRLAELLQGAGRLDDAYATLRNTRERLGDLEGVLEPMATVLLQLKKDDEAREIYALLLKKAPSNKRYLLEAARMDLRLGHVDRALGYLKILREEGALDRDGAVALARGLASKGKSAEAAETLLPFAEREPNSIELNSLTGHYLLDADDLLRSETHLGRAHAVAQRQGGDPETLFQYGRLAFRKGEVDNGISRIQQAIAADENQHRYRFELANSLIALDRKEHKSARRLALEQLLHVISHAERYAENKNPLDYLGEVHRIAAQVYADDARWDKAIPHLRSAQSIEPADLDTKVLLGRALFQVNDPDAGPVLRKVLARKPNDAVAALYLGLTLIADGKGGEALQWLERAANSGRPEVVEANYHAALLCKERGQGRKAAAMLKTYLAKAPETATYRQDARRVLDDIGSR